MNEGLQPNKNWLPAGHRIKAACPYVPLRGITGFHPVREPGGAAVLAPQALDKDHKGRVNTGTGDQPSNKGSSRFGTDCTSE